MRKLVILAACLISLNSFAQAKKRGPGDGGGGDPMTQQFIVMGKQLAVFYKDNPFKAKLSFDAQSFADKIKAIDQSVKDEAVKDMVEFTDDVLADKFGVEKAAVFDRTEQSILVNRKIWKSYSGELRLALITMEVTGLISQAEGVRYETALDLVQNRGALILSIPLDTPAEGKGLKWARHIVGQDILQFENITEYDVVIDGGVLGNGTIENERLGRFLENPEQDQEWYGLVQKAWNMHRPAYLMLTGPGGSIASVSSIYLGVAQTKDQRVIGGIGVYSLIFFKRRQIYEGPCVGEARSLGALERLNNCYLNPKNYYFEDNIVSSSVKETEAPELHLSALKSALHKFFNLQLDFMSNKEEILREALRENYLFDYTASVLGLHNTARFIMVQTLIANGFERNLIGPFETSRFWVKSNRKNLSREERIQFEAAIRFSEAMKTIRDLGLGFVDSGMSCRISKTDGTAANQNIGPALLEIKEIKALERSECCSGNYYDRVKVENQLFDLLKKKGYDYNMAAQKWLYTKIK